MYSYKDTHLQIAERCFYLCGAPPAGLGCWVLVVTWLGGARCVVVAGIGGGRGGFHCRRGGPGGGFVDGDLRLEFWKTPPPIDVLKLLDLNTKHKNLAHVHFT